jgi:uncharacterized membrane protein
MATVNGALRTEHPAFALLLRVIIVALTVATAAIHASLGGLLFMLNAIGYTTLAVLLILPGPMGQVRWLVRLALLGFAAATIGGWILFGARFPLAYIDKGIEVVLAAFLAFEIWLVDGGPLAVARRIRGSVSGIAGMLARGRP